MLVVLLRHAHRLGIGDSGLSALGLQQAFQLSELLKSGQIPTPTRLLTSPKRRARETMEALAGAAKLPLKADPALDERTEGESPGHFQDRVQEFWTALSHLDEKSVVYLCTHLDWIEACATQIPALASMAYENAKPILIEFSQGKWSLKNP